MFFQENFFPPGDFSFFVQNIFCHVKVRNHLSLSMGSRGVSAGKRISLKRKKKKRKGKKESPGKIEKKIITLSFLKTQNKSPEKYGQQRSFWEKEYLIKKKKVLGKKISWNKSEKKKSRGTGSPGEKDIILREKNDPAEESPGKWKKEKEQSPEEKNTEDEIQKMKKVPHNSSE